MAWAGADPSVPGVQVQVLDDPEQVRLGATRITGTKRIEEAGPVEALEQLRLGRATGDARPAAGADDVHAGLVGRRGEQLRERHAERVRPRRGRLLPRPSSVKGLIMGGSGRGARPGADEDAAADEIEVMKRQTPGR